MEPIAYHYDVAHHDYNENLTGYLSELSQYKKVPGTYSLKKVAESHLATMNAAEMDANWLLKDFFGHVKVITSKTSSRYPQMIAELRKVGLGEEDVELSPTVKGADLPKSLWQRVPNWVGEGDHRKSGHAGCSVAHYLLIKDTLLKFEKAQIDYYRLCLQDPVASEPELKAAKALVKKYSSVLILEDSNGFGLVQGGEPVLEGMGTVLREVMLQVPDDWDMFYFVCMHGEWGPAKSLPNKPLILQATYGCLCKCYAVKYTAYQAIVQKFESRMFDRSLDFPPVDHMVAELHKETKAYISKIPLAYRLNAVSLIQNDACNDIWQPTPR